MPNPDLTTLQEQAEQARARAADRSYQYAEGAAYYDGQAAHEQAVAERRRLLGQIQALGADGAKMRQKIGIARRQLQVAPEAHAAVVQRHTQGRACSTTDCTMAELRAILTDYQSKGFRVRPPRATASTPSAQALEAPLMRKIQALLADQKLPWSYAEAILKRMRGISDRHARTPMQLSTPEERRAIIAALTNRQTKQRQLQETP